MEFSHSGHLPRAIFLAEQCQVVEEVVEITESSPGRTGSTQIKWLQEALFSPNEKGSPHMVGNSDDVDMADDMSTVLERRRRTRPSPLRSRPHHHRHLPRHYNESMESDEDGVGGPEDLDVVGIDQDETLSEDYRSSDTELLLRLSQHQHDERLHRDSAIYRGTSVEKETTPPAPVTRPVIKRDKASIGITQNCTVCEVLTNGFHFGAVSCAACSAFFRRTVAENRVYECRKDGAAHNNCPINQSARCYCRACRFQKCLRVGMDPNAVQPHRDVIGSKRRKPSDSSSPGTPQQAKRAAAGLNNSNINSKEEEQQRAIQRARPSVITMEESLADHLNKNREFARAIMAQSGYAEVAKRTKISPTAHLLNSPNVLAEQLLAFSRTPITRLALNSSAGPFRHPETPTQSATVSGYRGVTTRRSAALSMQQEQHSRQTQRPTSVISNRLHTAKDEHLEDISGEMLVYEYEEDITTEDLAAEERRMNENAAAAASSSLTSSEAETAAHIREFMGVNGDVECVSDIRINVIHEFTEAYKALLERRRMIYCPRTVRDILGGTPPESVEVKYYDRTVKHLRLEVGLIADMLSSVALFRDLPLDDKVLLFKNVGMYYSVLEKHYMTARYGGHESMRIYNFDLTFTDLNNVEFTDFRFTKDETMTEETLKTLFIDPLRQSIHDVAGAMAKMNMAEAEFVGLMSVLLFDPTISDLSDEGRPRIVAARERAYKDWFSFYRARGYTSDTAAQRVGETLLLIPAIQNTAEVARENFHLVRVFEIFDYDLIMDDIFGWKPESDEAAARRIPDLVGRGHVWSPPAESTVDAKIFPTAIEHDEAQSMVI